MEREVILRVPESVAVDIWHYFNAGELAQKAFEEKYNNRWWKAARSNSFARWENISKQLRELNINPISPPKEPDKISSLINELPICDEGKEKVKQIIKLVREESKKE